MDEFYEKFIANKEDSVIMQLEKNRNFYFVGLVIVSIEFIIICGYLLFLVIKSFLLAYYFEELNLLTFLYLEGPYFIYIGSRMLILAFLSRNLEDPINENGIIKKRILEILGLRINGTIASKGLLNTYFFFSGIISCFIFLCPLSIISNYLEYTLMFISVTFTIIPEIAIFKLIYKPKNIIYLDYLFIRGTLGKNKIIRWSDITNAYIKRIDSCESVEYYLIIESMSYCKPIYVSVTSASKITRAILLDFILFMRNSNVKNHILIDKIPQQYKIKEKRDNSIQKEPLCKECNAILKDNATFCHNCGISLYSEVKFCAYCGIRKVKEGTFCYKCGNKLKFPELSKKKKKLLICPLCGNDKDTDRHFCPECGNQFHLSKSISY